MIFKSSSLSACGVFETISLILLYSSYEKKVPTIVKKYNKIEKLTKEYKKYLVLFRTSSGSFNKKAVNKVKERKA